MKRVDLVRLLESQGCVIIRHGSRHDWHQDPAAATTVCWSGTGASTGSATAHDPLTGRAIDFSKTPAADFRLMACLLRDAIVNGHTTMVRTVSWPPAQMGGLSCIRGLGITVAAAADMVAEGTNVDTTESEGFRSLAERAGPTPETHDPRGSGREA